jgi:hypothetical protein
MQAAMVRTSTVPRTAASPSYTRKAQSVSRDLSTKCIAGIVRGATIVSPRSSLQRPAPASSGLFSGVMRAAGQPRASTISGAN